MKLLFELAGDHPHLPFAELDLIGTIVERRDQVAVVEEGTPGCIPRLALAHAAMEYLGSCSTDPGELRQMLEDLRIESQRPFAARARRIHGSRMNLSQVEIERTLGSLIHGRVRLTDPEEEFRLVMSGDRCFLGRVIWRNDPGNFSSRRPGSRPFFHPGVMMPRMVRALINISCAREGEWLLDPFCGTGGIVMEADLLGVRAVGSDIDPLMVQGSRRNLPGGNLLCGDSRALPFRTASVDAVVTDLPYGQSVSIRARSLEDLYSESLAEIARILRRGRRAVLVTHRGIAPVAEEFFRVEASFAQRVHKSLTRHIQVLRR